jgi:predicted transcriptional regulator
MMREAKEYIWILHDQYLMSGYSLGAEALKRGVKIRSIDPKVYASSFEVSGEVNAEDKDTINNAVNSGSCMMGTLEKIDVFLYLSEKKVAIIGFPTLDGKFDYLGFSSNDEKAHKFCKDLFEFYWEKTEPKYKSDFGQVQKMKL